MGGLTFFVFMLVLAVFVGPAVVLWSLNTLIEHGQWGIGMIPHTMETYLAVMGILFLTGAINIKMGWK